MNKEGKDRNDSWFRHLLRRNLGLIAVMLLIIVVGVIQVIGGLFGGIPKNSLLKAGVVDEGNTVVQIAEKVGPSIVGIRTTVQSEASLDQFFDTGEQSVTAEGSGIIIRKNGYILTNYHVVQYADPRNSQGQKVTLEVFLPDDRKAKAKFIGGDLVNDLAVIKIDLKNLPVATLGDSSKLKVGALAVAIGNPLGLEFAGSVTTGVISALNRKIEVEDRTLNLIQTDAAINPGNSGGALVDADGKVIGINTVKVSISGVEGLGFAIPINDAKPIITQLIKYGYVKGRPLIGIIGQEIPENLAKAYNFPRGIFVTEVVDQSGAAKAGIKPKDILISLGGKSTSTMKELNAIKQKYKAGDTVSAVIVRNGKKHQIKLTFTEAK
ncbi:MAG TPA: trypsin-like peptidase domain-containing protein [Bacillota bacterium]|nr:trypsin-like peptidase domain-containing protein [Bacillota bacterium]HPT86816.1 trypsin-like peptidase domain-containing protein [Bacillota bacterium]